MGIDILVCYDCDSATFLDSAGTWAAAYVLAISLLATMARLRPFRALVDEIQPLAVAVAIPIVVGLLVGVLTEFPAYASTGLGAAVVAVPFGILAIADLAEDWRPPAALDLVGPRRALVSLGKDRTGRAV